MVVDLTRAAYERLFLYEEVADAACRGQFGDRRFELLKAQELHPLAAAAPHQPRENDPFPPAIVWQYQVDGYPGAEIFEFTDTVDRSMLGLVVEHAAAVWCLLDEELQDSGQPGQPVVTATVVYWGKEPWTAPRSTGEGLPEDLQLLGLRMEYKVLDVLHDPLERYSAAPLLQHMLRLARAKDRRNSLELLGEARHYLHSQGLSHLDSPFAFFSVFAALELFSDEPSEPPADPKQLADQASGKSEGSQQEGREETKQGSSH